MIELLNVYFSVANINWKMIIASVLTLFVYIITIALLHQYFNTAYITWGFVFKIMFVVACAWLPVQLVQYIFHRIDPPEHVKIMRQTKHF